MTSPRDARIAGVFIVVLAGGVVWNVAYLQDGPRDRRRTAVPVGVHVPLPNAQSTADARRPSGPLTLSLAALIEQSEVRDRETQPPPMSAPGAAGSAPDTTQSIVRPASAGAEPPQQTPPPVAAPVALIREVQIALAVRGYEPGVPDGSAGPMTRAAILAFEHDHGLPAAAEVSEPLLAALRAPGRRVAGGARWHKPTEAASSLVRATQQQLIASGYLRGQATGVPDAPTIAAIRAFEKAHRLALTGRISAPLVARLQQNRARIAAGQ